MTGEGRGFHWGRACGVRVMETLARLELGLPWGVSREPHWAHGRMGLTGPVDMGGMMLRVHNSFRVLISFKSFNFF